MYTSFLPCLKYKPPFHWICSSLHVNVCCGRFQISALDVFLRRWIVSCLQLFPLNVSDWSSTSTLLPHQRISVKCFLCLLCRIFVLVLLIYCTNAFTGKPLDFSVECFIWIHLHCTTCFTKVYRLPCVVFFSSSHVYLQPQSMAFVPQTLNCGVQARIKNCL